MRPLISASVVGILAVACGGDGDAPSSTESAVTTSADPSVDVTDPSAPSRVPPPVSTTAPSPPSSSTTSTTSTTPVSEPVDPALLRADGVGSVDFGVPVDEAVARLADLLGPPSSDVPIGTDGECVEGADWLDCVKELRIAEEGRLLTWQTLGLDVVLVDSSGAAPERVPAPLHLGHWRATVSADDTHLETIEGLHQGMTVDELSQLVSAVEFGYGEGLLDRFVVALPAGGGYTGRLDWIPDTIAVDHSDVRAVQQALNDHGADLAVDGEWGPRTQAAWLEFLDEHDLGVVTQQLWLTPEIGEALGLPPDDITIATIEPRHDPDAGAPTSTEWTLRADGFGPVDSGTPAGDALSTLVDLLGPPDRDVSSSQPDCELAIDRVRSVDWDAAGLHVVFTDWPGGVRTPARTRALGNLDGEVDVAILVVIGTGHCRRGSRRVDRERRAVTPERRAGDPGRHAMGVRHPR